MAAQLAGFRSLSGSSTVKEVSMPVRKKSSATKSKPKLKTSMKKKAGKKKKK
jgi:hypothetical protein